MKIRESISKEEFISAIPGSCGLLQPIEEKLHCTRKCLKDMIAKHPEIKQELADEEERELDRIMLTAIQDAKYGNDKEKAKAREIILRARGRERGFGEAKDKNQPQNNNTLVFLHTQARIPSVDDWQQRANRYTEKENRAIDAKFKELGME